MYLSKETNALLDKLKSSTGVEVFALLRRVRMQQSKQGLKKRYAPYLRASLIWTA